MRKSTRYFSPVVAVLALGCGDADPLLPFGVSPGPAGSGPGVRVFSGTAATLSSGEACTAEEGAQGDRWCGFVALSSEAKRNLYVVNVTQVVAGVPVSCGSPDPNCLLLTEDVAGSGANWHATFFAGDTLVFYDATITPHAWRPGMEGGRLLAERPAGVDVVFCSPASRGTAVACLSIPDEQPDVTLMVADLYAGAADGESEPLLAPIDTVIAGNVRDQGEVQRFSFGFPGSGYVAWTTRETPDGPEVLKLSHVDNPASQTTVAENVHAWDVSADGSFWTWLRAVDVRGTGLLQTAPFPDGASPSDVLPFVAKYGLHRSGALVTLTADDDVVSIPDPARAPETHLLLDQGVRALVELGDQGHIAYAKKVAEPNLVDLFVARLDGTKQCTLDESGSVPLNSVHFSPGVDVAVWARSQTEGYDAFHTQLADCATVPFAPDVAVLGWIGDGTAAFVDEFDTASSSGSMRFRNVGRNGALDPAPPTLIAEDVSTYASSGSTLLFTVTGGGDADGVYVRAFER